MDKVKDQHSMIHQLKLMFLTNKNATQAQETKLDTQVVLTIVFLRDIKHKELETIIQQQGQQIRILQVDSKRYAMIVYR